MYALISLIALRSRTFYADTLVIHNSVWLLVVWILYEATHVMGLYVRACYNQPQLELRMIKVCCEHSKEINYMLQAAHTSWIICSIIASGFTVLSLSLSFSLTYNWLTDRQMKCAYAYIYILVASIVSFLTPIKNAPVLFSKYIINKISKRYYAITTVDSWKSIQANGHQVNSIR